MTTTYSIPCPCLCGESVALEVPDHFGQPGRLATLAACPTLAGAFGVESFNMRPTQALELLPTVAHAVEHRLGLVLFGGAV